MLLVAGLAVGLVLAPALPARAGAEALGLLACIELARNNSSQVGQVETARAWEQEKLSAAFRRFFPRVDVDLAHQPKVDYFGRPVEADDVYNTDFKLTQPIYTGGALSARYDQAKQGLGKTGLMEAKAALEAAQEVVPNYYKLLAAREVVRLGRDLAEPARELVAAARQGVKEGYQRLEDLLAAEAKLLEVSYQVADSESQARSAGLRLKELIGLGPDQALELRPQSPVFTPPEADALMNQALKSNPSLLHAQAEDQYQSLGLSAAEALAMPRLNLIGRYGLEGLDFPGPDKYAGVMLQCDVNFGDVGARAYTDLEHQYVNETAFYDQQKDLYRKGLRLSILDGNSPAVSIAEARHNRRKAHDDARDTRERLRTQVLTLLEELKRQGDLLALASKQSELYAERLSVVRAKFNAGAATPAEVLEREVDLVQARGKAVQARYERWRVLALLCLISGQELTCHDAS
ncbi:MAG: TolC family protein [Thermodesulfobacteriota bacterium]